MYVDKDNNDEYSIHKLTKEDMVIIGVSVTVFLNAEQKLYPDSKYIKHTQHILSQMEKYLSQVDEASH